MKITAENILPTDQEVSDWYANNIDESIATVSSSIYKYRLWLKDYIKAKLEPIKHDIGGFEYREKKQL